MPALIPIEHDPFGDWGSLAEPPEPVYRNEAGQPFRLSGAPAPADAAGGGLGEALTAPLPGYFAQIGRDIGDFWRDPRGHAGRQLGGMAEVLTGVAREGLARQAELTGGDWSGAPLIGVGEGGALAGRLPALAELVTSGMAGPVPGGAGGMVLGAGPRMRGGSFTTRAELDTRLPPETRRAGEFEPGVGTVPVEGAGWLDRDLTEPGAGLQSSAADLDDAWRRAFAETAAKSPEQRALLNEVAKNPDFGPGSPQFWDNALLQADRARYWYEVSAKKMQQAAPDADPAQLRKIFDVVAATSPQADPYLNMRRTLGVLAEDAQGQPVATDLIHPSVVRSALAPGGLAGGKTGNFSDTFAHLAGLDEAAPLSVNDRQVAALHGVDPNDLGTAGGRGGAALYEMLSRFYQHFRDAENRARPGIAEGSENPLESWQLQALGWTQTRAGKNPAKAGLGGIDDYGQVIDRLSDELAAAGVDTSRGLFSSQVLQDPRVPNLVSGTRSRYLDPYIATIESASTMTPQGAEAHGLASALPPLEGAPGWAGNARYDLDRVQRRAMDAFARGSEKNPSILSDMIGSLLGRNAAVSRVDTRGQGMFEGELSPNMRIPLVAKTGAGLIDLDEGQRRALLAAVGHAWDQAAMAGSKFTVMREGDPLPRGHQQTYSMFLPGTEEIAGDKINQFRAAIGGYPLNVSRPANGTLIDINVGGYDASPTAEAVKNAAERLFPEHDVGIFPRAYASDYLEHGDYQGELGRFWQGVRDAGQDADTRGGRGARDPEERIRDFTAAQQKLQTIARQRDSEYQNWIDKYGPRIAEHRAANPPEGSLEPGGSIARLIPVDHDPFAAAPSGVP
jgi:hypothetical protein